jgi:ABC-type antimicrobial peptide transport system permease subunit
MIRSFTITLRMAVIALSRNVMRSSLTALGIIIGVASVIAMVEIGNGASKAVQATIASMGANTLLVMPGTASTGGVSFGSGSILTLTPMDCDAMNNPDRCPSLDGCAPVVRARTQVVYNSKNWVPMYIYGTTPNFLDVRDWTDLSDGSCFSDQDVAGAREVCVLGQTIVTELFGDESPIGRYVRINNKPFLVLGVLSKKGANMMGLDQDDIVLAPWTTIKYKVAGQSTSTTNQSAAGANMATTTSGSTTVSSSINSLAVLFPTLDNSALYPTQSATSQADTPQPVRFTNVDQILARAKDPKSIQSGIKEIQDLLHERHHIRSGQPDDFSIRDMTEMSNALGSTARLMGVLLLCVAMISLVVGGVGIMNIMLVSVTERTKEIGLRMAVGARAKDILRQFLVESMLLCLAGGIVGIIFGRIGSLCVRFFMNWPTEISYPAILASVGVSLAVGIVFGYYPAWKASRLDPIEALRYE